MTSCRVRVCLLVAGLTLVLLLSSSPAQAYCNPYVCPDGVPDGSTVDSISGGIVYWRAPGGSILSSPLSQCCALMTTDAYADGGPNWVGFVERYWTPGRDTWPNLPLNTNKFPTITNTYPSGYDPVLLWQMTTSAGIPKPVFAIGTVGRDSWSDLYPLSQIAAVYFLLRDISGNPQERMRIDYQGYVGIGTSAPAALLHVAGDARIDGTILSVAEDVAEWVRASTALAAGSVVIVDPRESNGVVLSRAPYDTRVAGVVSERPGVLLGERGEGRVKVAHTGRVRVKVDATYGAIAVGDLLVTSPTPGHAMRSEPVNVGGAVVHRTGTVLGKALESLASGQGEILTLVALQ